MQLKAVRSIADCKDAVTSVIPLKQSGNDHESGQDLTAELTDTLLATIDSLRQYVVETDPSLVDQFRMWAGILTRSLRTSISQADERSFGEVRTSIRGGLRDYHDRAGRYISELRARIATTTAALDARVATLQSGDSGAEARLKCEITRLESLEKLASGEEIRTGLRQSVVSVTKCLAQLRQEKDVTVAQLRHEIRVLQNSLEHARRAATNDVIGVHTRREFEKLLAQEITTGRAVCVVRLTLQNFANLTTWYQESTMDQLVAAFCKRARGLFPEDAPLGRWRENVFCVVLHSADTQALEAALVRKCSGNYVCMDSAYTRSVYLHVTVSSFSCPSGSDAGVVTQALDNSAAV